jgi:uncharacterized protein
MKCPIDNSDLVMADRQGIEIDYCPKCRGVWLDRGELDKIIERSAGEAPRQSYGDDPYGGDRRDDRRYEGDDDRDHRRPYRKKRGLLGDLFDFD